MEREGPPTFAAAVEMNEIGQWRVHLDVGVAVDTLLAGYAPPVELRTLDAAGGVTVQPWLGGAGGYEALSGPGGGGGGGSGGGGGAASALAGIGSYSEYAPAVSNLGPNGRPRPIRPQPLTQSRQGGH